MENSKPHNESHKLIHEIAPMTELERKYITMARIAVLLQRKGLTVSTMLCDDYCNMYVHLYNKETDTSTIVNEIWDHKITEKELLDWWSVLEVQG